MQALLLALKDAISANLFRSFFHLSDRNFQTQHLQSLFSALGLIMMCTLHVLVTVGGVMRSF